MPYSALFFSCGTNDLLPSGEGRRQAWNSSSDPLAALARPGQEGHLAVFEAEFGNGSCEITILHSDYFTGYPKNSQEQTASRRTVDPTILRTARILAKPQNLPFWPLSL
jgi:hypothetical protein